MNDREPGDMPSSSWLGWKASDRFIIASPHVNPTWMSPAACLEAPSRIPATLDAEVPALLPSNWRSITAEDDMAFIELSGPEKDANHQSFTHERWANKVWQILKFDDRYLRIYGAPSEMPLPPTASDVPTRHDVYTAILRVLNLLESTKASAALAFTQSLDPTREAA